MKLLRVILYCLLGGLPMTLAAIGGGNAGWRWLSGVVLAGSFVPVALFGPSRRLTVFGVIAPALIIVTALCTWSEALIFVPTFRQHAVRNLAASVVIYLIMAAALAFLARALNLTRADGHIIERRPGRIYPLLVMVCGMAYVIYYLIFGGITYQFFTKGYYPEATQIVLRLGLWFWAIQIGRGALMTLAVLPIICTLRISRRQAALAVGGLIWIAGGVAPLLTPNDVMGTTQRLIHIVEILTQNATLGITAVLLFRSKDASGSRNLQKVAAANR